MTMSTPEKPLNRRHHTPWETIAVTALPPGWRNVFRQGEGDSLAEHPCPAILMQEARATSVSWDEYPGGQPVRRSKETIAEPPCETRAVFADFDGADLCPASDAGNYERTVGPGETAR
jgi:hypothetical protein